MMADSYTHNQLIPATTWTVVHNLGSLTVAVNTILDYASGRHVCLPANVKVVDGATVQVTFTEDQTGTVRVVAN